MRIELMEINSKNKNTCISLKVNESQNEYITSNKNSLKDAMDNAEVVLKLFL